MTGVVAAVRRQLPRGYSDLLRQAVIWCAFYFAYLGVRHFADRNPLKAIMNGYWVIDFERRYTHHLFELTVQQFADSSSLLLKLAAYTYWNSEFTVIGLTLLWVYLRRSGCPRCRFARWTSARR